MKKTWFNRICGHQSISIFFNIVRSGFMECRCRFSHKRREYLRLGVKTVGLTECGGGNVCLGPNSICLSGKRCKRKRDGTKQKSSTSTLLFW
jgi:hypothetical protein